MVQDVKRNYDGSRRREQAAITQQRVVSAARELFLARGYAATTMADVAAAADVVVQTVYSSAGGKAALAKRVWDVTIAGDFEPVPLQARAQVQAIRSERDPRRVLTLYAALSRDVYQRLGPLARVLRAGADRDEELRALIDTTERERLAGTGAIAAHLHAAGVLRPGLAADRAGHRIWALNGGEVADGLTLRCGWSLDEYEVWLAESMIAAVLPGPGSD
jgi:AcrR family transcriptional regulator